MAIRRRARRASAPSEAPPIVHLWLLRLLIPLGAHRAFISPHGFANEDLAHLLGMGEWIDSDMRDFNPMQVRAELREMYRAAERKYANVASPDRLQGNVARLAELIGLSDADCRILELAVLLQNERLLDDTADWLGQLTSLKVFHAISVLLGFPEHEVRASLSSQGLLVSSGLVSVDRSGTATLRGKLNLLSDNFADHICSLDADPVELLRDAVIPSESSELGMEDYAHIEHFLAILRPYLRRSLDSGRKGVNIFLHGAPGTGKSQLAKALAQELRCELFEVASEDSDGDPVSGEKRLCAYRAAQSFFAKRRTMLLFDEVEDVFGKNDMAMFFQPSVAQKRKAWINRALECNPVPTLWLSNSINGLDPAFVRRFDMVFELTIPPKRQRASIIRQACDGLLDEKAISRIAELECLSPAVVTRAASVAGAIRDEVGEMKAADAVSLLISNTLEAQGYATIRKEDGNSLPEVYDPRLIHADADLEIVASGLVRARSGRLCLYGPPGTGKSAYARWLADRLDMLLLIRRASDLMGMYVGESEKNIARAFRDAEREGAVLLIDEVDSFLQDRRGAQRSWETSMVNEMLVQMESFSGVFVASTNLMGGLDQAALRRFDLKVKFDFLQPAQACELLQRYCDSLGLTAPEEREFARIARLNKLTPGDFAAIARQSRFRPIENAAALVGALEAECVVKEGARAAIGFV